MDRSSQRSVFLSLSLQKGIIVSCLSLGISFRIVLPRLTDYEKRNTIIIFTRFIASLFMTIMCVKLMQIFWNV
jgi:hypothetical protein